MLSLARVLDATVLVGPLRRPPAARTRRKMLAPFPDAVDHDAIDDFTGRHGSPCFAPVLVVIAAYNEENGIGGVLDNLPATCVDLPVDVLVVVDGAADRTADVAIAHGAYTCVAPVNRGQGAALRLGYQLAAYGGARYVITTDADGQYDNSEMPLLLEPLVAGTHDFVTGSRRLGAAPSDDRVRWLGVRVYAALASLLTWRKITDTSFGFRGMRTELACAVPLRQPQYQASELLLGALAGGARFTERPMTMRVRSAGTTKKGNNFVYGVRYGSVMTWTWLREYVGRRTLRLVGIGRRATAPAVEQPAQG
jgi:glycosyltransferase involved in cell wall biosynthesis